MPVRVAQRPVSGLLHSGVSSAPGGQNPNLVVGTSGGRCHGGPPQATLSPPLPPLSIPNSVGNQGVISNPLQAMASAAASLTQLNNMANGPLPPLGSGPGGPSLPPPQPATTPTHGGGGGGGGGPPTPHGVSGPPHLNGASPSPHPMPPHGMMGGSPHPHPHMGGGGPSPHPHHPGAPHMVGSPHHLGGPPHMQMGPGGPVGMQPQPGPGMCGPAGPGPMGPHNHPQGPGVPGQPPHMHNDPFYCSPFGSPYYR